jgi:predicted RNA binding protein YcfA (HicA-like mRNA interferase family)
MKIRDVTKLIEVDGWRIVKQKGSHRQYTHAGKPGKVTIAGQPKTLGSILEQAGLKR